MINVYTNGASGGDLGAWSVLIVDERGRQTPHTGVLKGSSIQRIELTAAIEGILRTPPGAGVTVFCPTSYVQRNVGGVTAFDENRDLWPILDRLLVRRSVAWGSADDDEVMGKLFEAESLARKTARIPEQEEENDGPEAATLVVEEPAAIGDEGEMPEDDRAGDFPGSGEGNLEGIDAGVAPFVTQSVELVEQPPSMLNEQQAEALEVEAPPQLQGGPPESASAEVGLTAPVADESGGDPSAPEESLTHLDAAGAARMVDISAKGETERLAVARGWVAMEPKTLEMVRTGQTAKGDVISVARLAGIMGAKQTPHLIPLCHPLMLTDVAVEFDLHDDESAIEITATVRTTGRTGVEMEALTAVSISALTIYDMCKSADRTIRIEGVRLVRKSGGKSGDIVLD